MPSHGEKKGFGTWLTDLDDTVKEAQNYMWGDGVMRKVLPQTIAGLRTLHTIGIPVGIVTEQPFAQMQQWIRQVGDLVLNKKSSDPYTVFNGIIIGEGGNVVKAPGVEIPRVVAPKGALKDREKLLTWLSALTTIKPASSGSWGILDGVDPEEGTFVKLPLGENQGVATISIWERGGHINKDSTLPDKYAKVKDRIDTAMRELDITMLRSFESGNGTLRIVPLHSNKGHTAEILKIVGLFSPQDTVYSCDGPNDLVLAQYLKKRGGKVVAVGNAVDQLKSLSDYTATLDAELGFAESLQLLFPPEYKESLKAVENIIAREELLN